MQTFTQMAEKPVKINPQTKKQIPPDSGKILIVDDNEKNTDLLARMIQKAGYGSEKAYSGQQALNKLDLRKDFDLVLLDVKMPEMDGYEVCSQIKSNPLTAEIPVIFLTASDSVSDVIKGFEAGGIDYVSKPFYMEELILRINTQVQLKQKSDLIKRYNQKLEHLNATKDKLFSIIAHDLRNPFATITMIIDFLKSHVHQWSLKQLEEVIDELHSITHSGNKLLENLLLWAKNQTGNLQAKYERVSLRAVLEENITLVKGQAKNKHIDMQIQFNSPDIIYTDPDLLSIVLRNLLTNAIKYTNHGGRIWVSSLHQENHVMISIKDNGIGMEKEVIDQLFKIEANGSRPGTDAEEGTGLGLILVKDFLTMLGGSITVSSKPGEGSEFKIFIPSRLNRMAFAGLS